MYWMRVVVDPMAVEPLLPSARTTQASQTVQRTLRCVQIRPFAPPASEVGRLVVTAASRVLNLPKDAVQVECRRFLPGWELHERLDLLSDDGLHSIQQV